MKHKIDQRYINKAVHIRKEFLNSIKNLMIKQEYIQKYLIEIEKYKNELTDITNTDDIIKSINIIEQNILIVEKEMSFFISKREQLEKEEIKLCELVLERYKGITEDEIKEQIYPHIEKINI